MKTNLKFAFMACLTLILVACSNESIATPEITNAENNTSLESELLGIVNDYRDSLGYLSLQYSEIA